MNEYSKKKNILVRLKKTDETVIGSGVIYYEKGFGDRYYLLTAAHCLFEDGDKFTTQRDSLIIEIFSNVSNTYEPLIISNIPNNSVCSPFKKKDYAIIVLDKTEVNKINSTIPNIQIINSHADVTQMKLLGFPLANNHEEVFPSSAHWLENRISTNQFYLNLTTDLNADYAQGYSGGGIFVEVETHEILLLGLFVRMQMEERGRVVYGQYINDINNLLAERNLPLINFGYLGAGGLTHKRITTLVDQTISNLGPNFGINVKTSIQPKLDALSHNANFYSRFKDSLNEWFHGIRFYGNETSSDVGILEKDFLHIREEIKTAINALSMTLPNQTDFSICVSLLESFKKAIDSLLTSKYDNLKGLSRESHKQEREQINRCISRLYTLDNYCDSFQHAINKTYVSYDNNPIALIEGEAGCGKTHVLAKLAEDTIKKGVPAFLLLGRDFNRKESIEKNICKLVHANCNIDKLFQDCNSIGIEKNQRFMILIDAINETDGRSYWKDNLLGFVERIKQYPGIGLVLSVRSTYFNEDIPSSLKNGDDIHIIHHNGLRGREDDAIREFCEYYKIAMPSLPMLNPEYSNPLMLHISCQVTQISKSKQFIMAHTGASSLFAAYRKYQDEILEEKNDAYYGLRVASKSINAIAEEFCKSGKSSISFSRCHQILAEKVGAFPTLLKELITSCILSKDRSIENDDEEQIRFTYQRLSDYFIAEYMVGNCKTKQEIISKFGDEKFKQILSKNYDLSGIIEQLAVLLPEKFDIEFWEVFDQSIIESLYVDRFTILLESLKWRSKEHIDPDKIISYLKAQNSNYSEYLNILVLLAPIPEHPFNSDRWNRIMKQIDLPHREQVLQRFLLDYSSDNDHESSHIKRLIEWAWREGISNQIDDEVARLAGQMMGWFLCSTKNSLRDKTTKSMVNLLQNHVKALISILKSFQDIDDPYITERLYAVAYGCILRTSSKSGKQEIASYVYEYVFVNGNLPKHLLTRDYMCNIVEYAVKEAEFTGVDMDLVLPPYDEEMPKMPTESDIEQFKIPYNADIKYWRAQNDILSSVVDGLADFGTKIVDSRVRVFYAWSFKIEHEYKLFKKNNKGKKRKALDLYEKTFHLHNSINEKTKKDPNWQSRRTDIQREIIQFCLDSLPKLSEQLSDMFGDELANKIRCSYIPNHMKVNTSKYQYSHDSWPIRYWIVKRVFDLGYDKNIHGEYDEYVKQIEGYARQMDNESGRIERIGKKYEWIALWEILGCLADNFCIENPWDTLKPMIYDGAWQNYWRDIDPSCITRRCEDNVNETWHDYNAYSYWNLDLERWLETTIDSVDIKNFLQRQDPDGNLWLTINDYKSEKEPQKIGCDHWSAKQRYYHIDIRAYIIKNSDRDKLVKVSNSQNFFELERLLPSNGHTYHITREKYWSRGVALDEKYYKNNKKPLYNGCPIKGQLLCELMNGNIEDDHSGTRATYYMPTKEMFNMLHIDYADEDGLFLNTDGEIIVCCNPNRTLHTLYRKDALQEELKNNNLGLVWIVVLEKIYNPNDYRHLDSRITTPSGLFYMDEKGEIKGNMTLHKRR